MQREALFRFRIKNPKQSRKRQVFHLLSVRDSLLLRVIHNPPGLVIIQSREWSLPRRTYFSLAQICIRKKTTKTVFSRSPVTEVLQDFLLGEITYKLIRCTTKYAKYVHSFIRALLQVHISTAMWSISTEYSNESWSQTLNTRYQQNTRSRKMFC